MKKHKENDAFFECCKCMFTKYDAYEKLQQRIDELEAEEVEYMKIALENATLRNALETYATHGNKITCVMCEQRKHYMYPCTCGLEQVRKGLEDK